MSLSYDNECLAAEVLAHYLKTNAIALSDEDASKEGRTAARNIRAAFEALEGDGQAEAPTPLDMRPYEAQALASLMGRDDTYGYAASSDIFHEAAESVHAAFCRLNRLQAQETGSNPPDADETP